MGTLRALKFKHKLMELINLKCNNCGADLEINRTVKFFTCTFCKSSLAIKKSGNVEYTEVLKKIETNTDSLLRNSESSKIEYEIARLDREWVIDSANYGTRNGAKPTSSRAVIGMSIGVVIFAIIMFTIQASIFSSGIPVFFAFIVGVFVLLFLIPMSYFYHISVKYETAEKEYQKKRAVLLAELKVA